MDILLNRRKLLSDKKALGQWGERRSEKLLKRKGLKTLTRNFSCKTGELDLVMVDTDRTIVFVEVRTKTRRERELLSEPEETVTYPKRLRLLRTARCFLAAHKIDDRPLRFDVVAIVLGQKGRPLIKHYENAFVL
jgi:putative endonuclease